jgi:Tol biopolymer transport system component
MDPPTPQRASTPAPMPVEPPPFATVGAATFARDDHGVVLASGDADATLRVTRVADEGARTYHASLSPDGQQIAFDSDRDGDRGVYVADASGARVRRVSGDGFAALPSWSPDGQRVLFARAEPDRPDVWNLWTVDLASGRERRLTSHDSGRPWGGSWFPDGQRVAYALGPALVVLDLDTGRTVELRSPVHGRPIRSPAVSPDGGHVVVQVLRDGAWLLAVPDGAARRLIDDPTADAFSWSPDGRRLAYHSARTGGWNVWVKTGRW